MPDESLIADFDPFDIMDEECARLYDFFRSLDAGAWKEDTRCEGWTRREIVAHLAAGESYNRACLDDKVKELFEEASKAGAKGMDAFNAWTIDLRADKTADEVLEEWRSANEHFRTEMRRRGRDGKVATSVGPYPVGWQAFHLASEYAT
ncbi:MAG: maleylpyruvate isomerase N-terminal domain-containing protein, partial [Candidatus Binatia bacterium]